MVLDPANTGNIEIYSYFTFTLLKGERKIVI